MSIHRVSSTARIIGVTNRSVSGTMPNIGQYESSLERDFMEISRFDSAIESIIPQPITLAYNDPAGKARKYTPDGIIHFKQELFIPSILYEIKHRVDFRADWRVLLPKFKAAKSYSTNKGWIFKVITEKEIRTPYLDNVKFLWSFKERIPSQAMIKHVLNTLSDLDECDPDMLLCSLCSDSENRARMIPVLWYLVANNLIGCDLEAPLTMRSKIWLQDFDYENN